MSKIRIPFVDEFRDRHGKVRRYFRRKGVRVALPGALGSAEFMAAYQAALAQQPAPAPALGSARPGTIRALVAGYLASAAFQQLRASTQNTYRGILERFRVEHGDDPVKLLRREHIVAMLGKKVKTPAAANNWLRLARLLMRFAILEGIRPDDPTAGIKNLKMRPGGFHTWTEDEIAAFERTHAVGTRARLALALLLHTAQRRSDVIRMGRQHVRNGVLHVKQVKTGAVVEIPIHTELQAAIDAVKGEHLTYLTTRDGAAFTAAGFTNWFRDCCNEAGLPKGCSPHGLRKAAARRLAEAGCTPHQIMSITGHRTLKEVTRYTEAANRSALAVEAMAQITARTSSAKPK